MKRLSRRVIAATIAFAVSAIATLAFSPDAAAQDNPSYKGKTVTLIINSAAGGGTDLTNRMIGTYLAKYLPGEPMVVYRNIAGGGGLKANN